MPTQDTNFMQALDGIRDAIRAASAKVHYEFPHIETGPYEEVLGFSTTETIVLKNVPPAKNPYFSSTGVITDVLGREIPGTSVATSFPLDVTKLPTLFAWPQPQDSPYNEVPPEILFGNSEPAGYSRQAYFWNDGKDSIVTVGPAVPKIVTPLVNGAGQFWVAAVGVISQGTGKYEGVRGQQAYVGSSYIDPWPPTLEELFAVLAAGITVHSASWIKLVLDKWQHESAPKSLQAASPPKSGKLPEAAAAAPTAPVSETPTGPEVTAAVENPPPPEGTTGQEPPAPKPSPASEEKTAPAETPQQKKE